MKKLLICAAVFAASTAFADNNSNSGVGNSITDTHNGASVGGSISNANFNSNSSHSNSNSKSSASAKQSQYQSQKATSSVKSSGNSNNSYTNRQAASSAGASFLVASEDTCSGSTSAGAQGIGFGLNVGSTWQDKDCVRRKDARELYNMGEHDAAKALLCQNDAVAAAMAAAGKECLGRNAVAQHAEVHYSDDSSVESAWPSQTHHSR